MTQKAKQNDDLSCHIAPFSQELLWLIYDASVIADYTYADLIYPSHLLGAALWNQDNLLRRSNVNRVEDVLYAIQGSYFAQAPFRAYEPNPFFAEVRDVISEEMERAGHRRSEDYVAGWNLYFDLEWRLSSGASDLLRRTTFAVDRDGTRTQYVNCFDLMGIMLKESEKYPDVRQVLPFLNISKHQLLSYFSLNYAPVPTPSRGKLDLWGNQISVLEDKWIIGRSEEVTRLVKVLSRKQKRNAILVGDPGVGKTTILELLAKRIESKQVPADLQQTVLWNLNTSSLVSEAQFRGDLEQKVNSLIAELEKQPEVVLCIEDIHALVGMGASEGGLSAGSILREALSNNRLKLIGTTTYAEYKKQLEKDQAFVRWFEVVFIQEPSLNQTRDILVGFRDDFEKYHKVIIPNTILEKCLELSQRYLTARPFPDKAIDLLDFACLEARLEHEQKYQLPLSQSDGYVEQLLETSKQAIESYLRREEYELILPWKKFEQFLLRQQTDKDYLAALQYPAVSSSHLANVLSLWSGVPTAEISSDEETKMTTLESSLQKRVIGQNRAVSIVADAVRRARLGFQNIGRPLASFFFAGPTGVGKTELAKALSESLFGSDGNLVRFDMSEFMEKHSTSRLIGSPPGYVGYGEGGQLTEAVKKQPYSVVLFDEIEKAHEDVSNVMLQILDDGRLTDSTGQKVDFTNTILIFTSNLGYPKDVQEESLHEEKTYRYISGRVQAALEKYFRPEFINRIDRMVVFNNLSFNELTSILDKYINELRQKLNAAKQPVVLNVTNEAKELIVKAGYQPGYGARPLARALSRMVEIPLSNLLFKYSLKQPLLARFSTDRLTKDLTLTVSTLNLSPQEV